ncbi:transmembrane protein 238-like [Hyla sarda]|uniref:transmembrane protein 238-like n=1 Tax=Hyla sarda TaxID=327740 RepID=UPI0024C432AF|nr:transmembrane protein 238-like [Hyla sarda]
MKADLSHLLCLKPVRPVLFYFSQCYAACFFKPNPTLGHFSGHSLQMALARCRLALLFAIFMDLVGLASLLVGIFAELKLNGQDFGDLLIYTGAILVFLSLVGWIFWYTGNIEISLEELQQDYSSKAGTLARLARKISRHLSHSDVNHGKRKRHHEHREAMEKVDTLQLSRTKNLKKEVDECL